MESIKKIGSNLIGTPIGTIAGAAAFYFGAKKFAKLENKWALIAVAVAGAFIGSKAESMIRAKFHKPTITPAKK